ncbi:MAG TPA: magnesium transporter CorA family protein [Mycobacteriales bacterium]|jgi:magnesium transporter|nr:magnesium transporter CorA family protein [Mycobacteriales bacterium]
MLADRWTDLLDPSIEEIEAHLPQGVHLSALEQLNRPSHHDDDPRPKLEAHGEYVFGVLLIAVVGDGGEVFYQELNLIMSRDRLLTIRKSPANGRAPYNIEDAQLSCRSSDSAGMVIYHLVDDIAERYLDLIDRLDDAIEELEDGIESWEPDRVRKRIAQLRHDMLQIRRTLSPIRDMLRQVVDDRIEFDGEEVFTRDVELCFAAAYDKMLRASDGLELSRDLVASARDYAQAKIANDQNDVMKRLTVIASVLLLPTFIVGLYGQNFVKMPELHWQWGYGFSWGLIVVTTIGQVAFFKWRKWV